MIDPEKIGTVVSRVAMAVPEFPTTVLKAALLAEARLLPGDREMLETWADFIQVLRIIVKHVERPCPPEISMPAIKNAPRMPHRPRRSRIRSTRRA